MKVAEPRMTKLTETGRRPIEFRHFIRAWLTPHCRNGRGVRIAKFRLSSALSDPRANETFMLGVA